MMNDNNQSITASKSQYTCTPHSTIPCVGGSTAPPSPPTAAPVGKAPTWLLTDWQGVCLTEESCSDVRWGGRQHCMLTEAIGVSTLQHTTSTQTCCLQMSLQHLITQHHC